MDCLDKLRNDLELKIKTDWLEKWHSFGEYNTQKTNRKSKFYQALAFDIFENTKVKISRDTVQRFDQAIGGDSPASLQAFCIYLGFDTIEAFEKANECNKITEVAELEKKRPLNGKKALQYLSIIVFGYVAYLVANSYYEAHLIKNAIINGNKCQFETYKKLPKLDTLQISNYYSKGSNASKSIITVLLGSQKGNRVIGQPSYNPSFYKIMDIDVLSIKNNIAIVETDEQWFLKWYDTKANRFSLSYDVQNKQLYELEKTGDKWMIVNNYFVGKATVIPY
jgi:hypothetical protein